MQRGRGWREWSLGCLTDKRDVAGLVLARRRAAMLKPEARAACLGSSGSNLISCTISPDFINLHRDPKDGPLTLIAWTNARQPANDEATTFDGGEFVIPALQLRFHPAATSRVTVVLMATSVLTHGTLPQVITGKGKRVGVAHYLRCQDMELTGTIRLGAMSHFNTDNTNDAMALLGQHSKPERVALREPVMAAAGKGVATDLFSAAMLQFRAARRAGYDGDPTASFCPWFSFFNENLRPA